MLERSRNKEQTAFCAVEMPQGALALEFRLWKCIIPFISSRCCLFDEMFKIQWHQHTNGLYYIIIFVKVFTNLHTKPLEVKFKTKQGLYPFPLWNFRGKVFQF